MRYDPSLQVWRRVSEPGMAGVPPPLVYPGDEHLLAHAIETYARRRYGVHGDDADESDMVDAAGKPAGGSFGLGRNLAGSDVAADAVGRARQADLDGEQEREEKAKADECVHVCGLSAWRGR